MTFAYAKRLADQLEALGAAAAAMNERDEGDAEYPTSWWVLVANSEIGRTLRQAQGERRAEEG